MMSNRLAPRVEPWPEAIATALAAYPAQDGYLLSLFRTFANSERFLKKAVPNLLDKGSPVPLRVREIVILRTTANRNCEYEWGVHVTIFAGAAKLTPEQITATRALQIDAALWSPPEVGLLSAIDQLCADGRLDNATQAQFEADWSLEQQLEILALVGTYHTISFVANVARLPGEAFGARFPG
jgi:alkylhydroperoxidase family enzyme